MDIKKKKNDLLAEASLEGTRFYGMPVLLFPFKVKLRKKNQPRSHALSSSLALGGRRAKPWERG